MLVDWSMVVASNNDVSQRNVRGYYVDTMTVSTMDSLMDSLFRPMNERVCILVQMIVDPKARPETIVFECSRSRSTSASSVTVQVGMDFQRNIIRHQGLVIIVDI